MRDAHSCVEDHAPFEDRVPPLTIWLCHLIPDPRLDPALLCVNRDISRLRQDVLREQCDALLQRRDRLLLMLDCDVCALVDELAVAKVIYEPPVDMALHSRSYRRHFSKRHGPASVDELPPYLHDDGDRVAIREVRQMNIIQAQFDRWLMGGVFADWGVDAASVRGKPDHPAFERFIREFHPSCVRLFCLDPESKRHLAAFKYRSRSGDEGVLNSGSMVDDGLSAARDDTKWLEGLGDFVFEECPDSDIDEHL